MATLFAILAGLKGTGGIIAAIGAVSGGVLPFSPFLRAHWKLIAVAAAGVVAFGLLFAWHVSTVHEARLQERAVCEGEKRESRDTADEIDRQSSEQATADHLAALEAANDRALAAQAQAQEYQDEIAALPAQVRACRAATPSDIRRLLN